MKLTADSDDKSIIIIAGPTASGKTEAALLLAGDINGEIISADSRQVYRHVNIGTAQPTPEQRKKVPHHLVDFLDPIHTFSAADFISLANKAVKDILKKGRKPIIAGGTGLYIKAFMDGLAPLPGKDIEIREMLENQIKTKGLSYLYHTLQTHDPETARHIDPHNPARIIRAMEVYLLTGKGMAFHHKNTKKSSYHFRFICFFPQKGLLMKRITNRIATMLKTGMIEETQDLLRRWGKNCPALLSLGYRHVIAYLRGEINKEILQQSIITDTWQYAKRQKTWFKKDERIIPIYEEFSLNTIKNTLSIYNSTKKLG